MPKRVEKGEAAAEVGAAAREGVPEVEVLETSANNDKCGDGRRTASAGSGCHFLVRHDSRSTAAARSPGVGQCLRVGARGRLRRRRQQRRKRIVLFWFLCGAGAKCRGGKGGG